MDTNNWRLSRIDYELEQLNFALLNEAPFVTSLSSKSDAQRNNDERNNNGDEDTSTVVRRRPGRRQSSELDTTSFQQTSKSGDQRSTDNTRTCRSVVATPVNRETKTGGAIHVVSSRYPASSVTRNDTVESKKTSVIPVSASSSAAAIAAASTARLLWQSARGGDNTVSARASSESSEKQSNDEIDVAIIRRPAYSKPRGDSTSLSLTQNTPSQQRHEQNKQSEKVERMTSEQNGDVLDENEKYYIKRMTDNYSILGRRNLSGSTTEKRREHDVTSLPPLPTEDEPASVAEGPRRRRRLSVDEESDSVRMQDRRTSRYGNRTAAASRRGDGQPLIQSSDVLASSRQMLNIAGIDCNASLNASFRSSIGDSPALNEYDGGFRGTNMPVRATMGTGSNGLKESDGQKKHPVKTRVTISYSDKVDDDNKDSKQTLRRSAHPPVSLKLSESCNNDNNNNYSVGDSINRSSSFREGARPILSSPPVASSSDVDVRHVTQTASDHRQENPGSVNVADDMMSPRTSVRTAGIFSPTRLTSSLLRGSSEAPQSKLAPRSPKLCLKPVTSPVRPPVSTSCDRTSPEQPAVRFPTRSAPSSARLSTGSPVDISPNGQCLSFIKSPSPMISWDRYCKQTEVESSPNSETLSPGQLDNSTPVTGVARNYQRRKSSGAEEAVNTNVAKQKQNRSITIGYSSDRPVVMSSKRRSYESLRRPITESNTSQPIASVQSDDQPEVFERSQSRTSSVSLLTSPKHRFRPITAPDQISSDESVVRSSTLGRSCRVSLFGLPYNRDEIPAGSGDIREGGGKGRGGGKADSHAPLTEQELQQIEMFYRGHKTQVYACRSEADLLFGSVRRHSTASSISRSSGAISLTDLPSGPASNPEQGTGGGWTWASRGVPVTVLDSGDGKRPRRLYILLAERGTGFALWLDTVDHLTTYSGDTTPRSFHTMHLSKDHTKLAGFRFYDALSAAQFYQNIQNLVSNPHDSLLSLSNKSTQARIGLNGCVAKKSSWSRGKDGVEEDTSGDSNGVEKRLKKKKLPHKSHISAPCCFVHVTKLEDAMYIRALGSLNIDDYSRLDFGHERAGGVEDGERFDEGDSVGEGDPEEGAGLNDSRDIDVSGHSKLCTEC